ncbi:MAG: hypothetical protein ACPG5Z_10955 [Pseudoalteromonas sp.]
MIKYVGVCLLMLLTGCSEPAIKYSDIEQVKQQLRVQNEFLQPLDTSIASEITLDSKLPFSESYLLTRHDVYRSLRAMDLTKPQQQLADYLSISERFPARYFPWPANINVVENMLSNDLITDQEIAQWIGFTIKQLSLGLESKLKLNKIELNSLKSHVAKLEEIKDIGQDISVALESLSDYLSSYTPRGSVGLHGLPNGASWYQSKLNYFAQKTDAPLIWLAKIQNRAEFSKQQRYTQTFDGDHSDSLLEKWLMFNSYELIAGLDWEQSYYNLPLSASLQIEKMSDSDKAFWLAMMETDLGIHYHAWTVQQAKVNLQKRIQMSDKQAAYAVENLVYFPAFSFAFAQLLDNKL